MQYTPKLPDDSVNIPKGSFLLESGKLLIGLMVAIVGIYSFLWISMNLIVNTISPESERKLQKFFKNDLTYYDDNRRDSFFKYICSLSTCRLDKTVYLTDIKHQVSNTILFL